MVNSHNCFLFVVIFGSCFTHLLAIPNTEDNSGRVKKNLARRQIASIPTPGGLLDLVINGLTSGVIGGNSGVSGPNGFLNNALSRATSGLLGARQPPVAVFNDGQPSSLLNNLLNSAAFSQFGGNQNPTGIGSNPSNQFDGSTGPFGSANNQFGGPANNQFGGPSNNQFGGPANPIGGPQFGAAPNQFNPFGGGQNQFNPAGGRTNPLNTGDSSSNLIRTLLQNPQLLYQFMKQPGQSNVRGEALSSVLNNLFGMLGGSSSDPNGNFLATNLNGQPPTNNLAIPNQPFNNG